MPTKQMEQQSMAQWHSLLLVHLSSSTGTKMSKHMLRVVLPTFWESLLLMHLMMKNNWRLLSYQWFLFVFILLGGRCIGLMVSTVGSGSNSLCSSPGWGHCAIFLGKTLSCRRTSLHPSVWMGTSIIMGGGGGGGNLTGTTFLHVTCIFTHAYICHKDVVWFTWCDSCCSHGVRVLHAMETRDTIKITRVVKPPLGIWSGGGTESLSHDWKNLSCGGCLENPNSE